MSLKVELQKALAEIGDITPWWSEENGMYLFEHPLYPYVMHADPDIEKTKAGYLRALKGFLKDRLSGNLDETVDRVTSGRGGVRPGSGRPPSAIKTKHVRLPIDIADWLKSNPANIETVRKCITS